MEKKAKSDNDEQTSKKRKTLMSLWFDHSLVSTSLLSALPRPRLFPFLPWRRLPPTQRPPPSPVLSSTSTSHSRRRARHRPQLLLRRATCHRLHMRSPSDHMTSRSRFCSPPAPSRPPSFLRPSASKTQDPPSPYAQNRSSSDLLASVPGPLPQLGPVEKLVFWIRVLLSEHSFLHRYVCVIPSELSLDADLVVAGRYVYSTLEHVLDNIPMHDNLFFFIHCWLSAGIDPSVGSLASLSSAYSRRWCLPRRSTSGRFGWRCWRHRGSLDRGGRRRT